MGVLQFLFWIMFPEGLLGKVSHNPSHIGLVNLVVCRACHYHHTETLIFFLQNESLFVCKNSEEKSIANFLDLLEKHEIKNVLNKSIHSDPFCQRCATFT